MAHFAKLDDNNIVLAVHVVNNDVITIDGIESEQAGIDFLTQLHGHTNWKQTSYNSSFRTNFAGIGSFYNSALDAFSIAKPYPSWVLDEENNTFVAPVNKPDSGMWLWDEDAVNWVEYNGS